MDLQVDEAAVDELCATPERWHREIVADVFADAVRLCPVDTGEMKASIRSSAGDGVGIVSVGTDHWEPQEYGARPHVIEPRGPGYPLRFYWAKAGRVVAFWRVNHPGNAPQPFMRPALYKDRS